MKKLKKNEKNKIIKIDGIKKFKKGYIVVEIIKKYHQDFYGKMRSEIRNLYYYCKNYVKFIKFCKCSNCNDNCECKKNILCDEECSCKGTCKNIEDKEIEKFKNLEVLKKKNIHCSYCSIEGNNSTTCKIRIEEEEEKEKENDKRKRETKKKDDNIKNKKRKIL
jgi:hypothetical protein